MPLDPSVAELKTGGVWSTLELFVTVVVVKDAASLPELSWIALLVVAVLDVGAAYEMLTGANRPIGEAKVNVTTPLEPVEETPVTAMGTPLFKTVKSAGSAVVERTVSLNVKVTVVPAVLTAAEFKVGGVRSNEEPLVTARAENDTASLPALSWIALLLMLVSGVGASYVTVTTCVLCTAVANVRITVDVFPAEVAELMVTGLPFTNTVYALTGAVVARTVSLYDNVNVVPFAASAAELNTGGVWSTLEPFDTVVVVKEIASFPALSWIALFVVEVSADGAAYETLTGRD